MSFDPFSSGGAANRGSHVVFAPTPIGPDPNAWQQTPAAPPPAAPPPASPGSGSVVIAPAQQKPALDAAQAGQPLPAAKIANAAQTFAQALALQSLTETTSSTSTAIANKLPGAPGNVYGKMEEMRDEEKLVDSRRELAKQMAKKDDDMNYRS